LRRRSKSSAWASDGEGFQRKRGQVCVGAPDSEATAHAHSAEKVEPARKKNAEEV